MYQYEKSRKAQLHEKSFSWFWGIGGCKTSGGRLFCTDRSGTETYTNKLKRHFVRTNALLANFVLNSVQKWLYRKNSYTEFFARAQFIKDFLSRIRYNFSKLGSVSDAKMLRIPLIFGITFFFWTIKGTACQISSFMYHFRPYSLFKVSSSSTL